jgi:hypothetical protein
VVGIVVVVVVVDNRHKLSKKVELRNNPDPVDLAEVVPPEIGVFQEL